jgi:CubicO group peptidase (beta-lactamase class C family)
LYRDLVRGLIAALSLVAGVAGCRADPKPKPEPSAEVVEPAEGSPEPAPSPAEAHDAARKRACIDEALAGAAARHHALLRSLCAEWVERDIPGLALAIVEPGAEPFTFELGVRCFGDEGGGALIEASTPFRLGSISKTVTAALALGLVAEGKVELETRAGALVEGFAGQGELPQPTLAALLRHRSGLGEIEPEVLVELDGAWLPALARSPAAGAPGEYHYSNAGYSLVGAMLAAASERDYPSLVAERVAEPLGLDSFVAGAERARAPACGHLEYDPDRHPIPVREDLEFMPGDPSWMDPAGGVLGSVADLARFALALGREQLPGSAAMLEPGEPLLSAHARSSRSDERYGYGLRSWVLDDGTRAYGHSGNNVAFAAELMFVPGRRAIALLANCGTGLPASVAAAERLLSEPAP